MMDAREEFGRRLLLPRKDGNLMLISLLFQSSIPFPAIGMYNTAGLNRFFDERLQTARGRVSDSRHPYSSGAFSIFLGCNHYQHLFLRLPSPQPLFRSSHVSLVNLDSARQSVTSGADHGTPQFVQPCPRGLVTRQAENPLHPESTGSCLQRRHPPDQPEPHRQRLTCTVKNGSGRHRCLVRATCALNQSPAYTPAFGVSTPRTQITIRPAQLEQIIQTSLFGRKPSFKFSKRPGIVFHTREYYM